MENFNNMVLGSGEPIQSLNFGGIYVDPQSFLYDFTEWTVNTKAGCELDITNSKVVIKKFKINTWILRSPKITGTLNSKICEYARGVVSVKGLNNKLDTIFTGEFRGENNHGAGSDLPKMRGLIFKPYVIGENGTAEKGYTMMERMYTWEGCWSAPDKRDLPAVADWNLFRVDGPGHGSYWVTKDRTDLNIIPSNLYDFNTRERGNGQQTGAWYLAFGLYTSNLTAGDGNGYVDISDDPIIIELYNNKGVDLSTQECWDVYLGDIPMYHKEKTIDNCWIKYKYAKYATLESNPSLNLIKVNGYGYTGEPAGGLIIPSVSDWKDKVCMIEGSDPYSYISWEGLNIVNSDFWTEVVDFYKNNNISASYLDIATPFKNCNLTGELTLNLDRNYGTYKQYGSFKDAFNGSSVQNITFNNKGVQVTVTQNMFRNAKALKSITLLPSTSYFGTYDCSGMFEYCGSLKTYSNNLLRWSFRGNFNDTANGSTNIAYAFELSGFEEIPSYDTNNRFSDDNTIISYQFADQAFNACTNLIKIGPVIDLRYVNPTNSAHLTFNNCPKLQDVRIKNLNHGTWRFDGRGSGKMNNGYLPSLNQDSINYLIDNLYDLTTSNPDQEETVNNSFRLWNTQSPDIQYGTKYVNVAIFKKAFTQQETPKSIAYTNQSFENLKINVSGLIPGLRLEFGPIDKYIEKTENSLIDNKEYIINKSNENNEGFILFSDSEEIDTLDVKDLKITISLVDNFNMSNPAVSSADLYGPEEWRDKVTSEHISSAKAKGWTIYIGGSVAS